MFVILAMHSNNIDLRISELGFVFFGKQQYFTKTPFITRLKSTISVLDLVSVLGFTRPLSLHDPVSKISKYFRQSGICT